MEWGILARLTIHAITIVVAAGLLYNEFRWQYTKLDLAMWSIYIITLVCNVLLVNYYIGLLGGWYDLADAARLLRWPNTLLFMAHLYTFYIIRYQRDRRRYWEKQVAQLAGEIEYLTTINKRQQRRIMELDEVIARQMERRVIPLFHED